MNRKQRRKDFKKKQKMIKKALKYKLPMLTIAKSMDVATVSFCPHHGSYDEDTLCPCYGPDGKNELGQTYEQVFNEAFLSYGKKTGNPAKDAFLEKMNGTMYCPIHGPYKSNNLCPCHDENGELKPDWDKDL